MTGPWGVYAHVPWCRARCPYCAFAITPERGPVDARGWRDRVLSDLAARRPDFPPDPPETLYFGGGTPSRAPVDALAAVIDAVGPAGEVTVEANPEDVDGAWLAGVVGAGVTRVSLGVQTFDPAAAKRLGRAHTSAVARDACARVADAVATWSIDVIFAVPGDPPGRFDRDLDAALALGAPHVSLYGLTIEEGTAFGAAAARGRLAEVPDDAWRRDYDHAVARLRAAGRDRYEVSNFARAGYRSAHNRLYWTDRPYLGLGPSAHGYLPDGRRTADEPALEAWLAGAPAAVESPDPAARATDLLLSGLRAVEGVDRAHLRARTGLAPREAAVAGLVRAGLLDPDPGALRLTDAGFPVCDAVVARLVDALCPP